METPPFNPEPTRMMTRSVLAEIPTRLGRLSMTDPNNGNIIIIQLQYLHKVNLTKYTLYYHTFIRFRPK